MSNIWDKSVIWTFCILALLMMPLASAEFPEWDGNFHGYNVNDLVTYNGVDYKCLQSHLSQPGWTPLIVPALWNVYIPNYQDGYGFVAGYNYQVNYIVEYNDVYYRVIQAHTSQNDWKPDIVPALFEKLLEYENNKPIISKDNVSIKYNEEFTPNVEEVIDGFEVDKKENSVTIKIDSEKYNSLNKSAKITVKDISFITDPKVYYITYENVTFEQPIYEEVTIYNETNQSNYISYEIIGYENITELKRIRTPVLEPKLTTTGYEFDVLHFSEYELSESFDFSSDYGDWNVSLLDSYSISDGKFYIMGDSDTWGDNVGAFLDLTEIPITQDFSIKAKFKWVGSSTNNMIRAYISIRNDNFSERVEAGYSDAWASSEGSFIGYVYSGGSIISGGYSSGERSRDISGEMLINITREDGVVKIYEDNILRTSYSSQFNITLSKIYLLAERYYSYSYPIISWDYFNLTYTVEEEDSFSISGTEGSNDWYTSNVNISWNQNSTYCIDSVNTCTPSINYTYNSSSDVVIDDEGNNYIRYYFSSNTSEVFNESFKIDKTAPTTSGEITSGTEGSNDWYISNITYNITPTDATSGVNITYYCTDSDNTCTPETEYTSTIELSTNGSHYIRYYSKDNAGNNQTIQTESFKIDKTAPTTSGEITSGTEGSNDWYISNITYNITPTDATSGVNITYYCTDSDNTCTPETEYTSAIELSTNGSHYIRYYSKDNAGNNQTIQTESFKIDKTAPTTSGEITSGTEGLNDWYNTNVEYTITPADATSGVNITYYCLDDDSTGLLSDCTPTTEYIGALSITSQGNFRVKFYSQDNAGNNQTIQTESFKIDKTAPVSEGSINSGTLGDNGWYVTNVEYIITEDDGVAVYEVSEVAETYYCIDTANTCTPTTEYSSTITLSSAGNHYIRYYSVDYAGNEQTTQSTGAIKIDKVAPTTSGEITSGTLVGEWYTTDVIYTITPADATSGIDIIYYCNDSNNTCTPTIEYTAPLNLSTSDEYYIRYYSVDNAGNEQTTQSSGLIKLKHPHEMSILSTYSGDYLVTNTINISINITDDYDSTYTIFIYLDDELVKTYYDQNSTPDLSYTFAGDDIGTNQTLKITTIDIAGNIVEDSTDGFNVVFGYIEFNFYDEVTGEEFNFTNVEDSYYVISYTNGDADYYENITDVVYITDSAEKVLFYFTFNDTSDLLVRGLYLGSLAGNNTGDDAISVYLLDISEERYLIQVIQVDTSQDNMYAEVYTSTEGIISTQKLDVSQSSSFVLRAGKEYYVRIFQVDGGITELGTIQPYFSNTVTLLLSSFTPDSLDVVDNTTWGYTWTNDTLKVSYYDIEDLTTSVCLELTELDNNTIVYDSCISNQNNVSFVYLHAANQTLELTLTITKNGETWSNTRIINKNDDVTTPTEIPPFVLKFISIFTLVSLSGLATVLNASFMALVVIAFAAIFTVLGWINLPSAFLFILGASAILLIMRQK